MGSEMAFSDLSTCLLCYGPKGELLKHAMPFLEYFSGFPSWQNAGLKIKDGLVYIESDLNV